MAAVSVVRNRRVTGVRLYYSQGQRVERGGVAVGTTVYSGGAQAVFSGGVASKVNLMYGGMQGIFAGGVDRGAIIYAGGQQIASGGKTSGAKIYASGAQYVYIRGTSYNPAVSGGVQYVYKGVASGGKFYSGVQLVNSGGSAIGTTLVKSSMQYVQYGTAKNVKVNGISWQYIYSKGKAVNTTVSGGMQSLYKGTASGTKLLRGSLQYIYSAGTAVNTTLSAGSIQYIYSGVAKNTTVGTSSIQMVYHGGVASSTRVSKLGLLTVSGGTIKGATISAGGGVYVHGNGVVSNLNIKNGGKLLVNVSFSLRGANTFAGVGGVASSGRHVVLAKGASLVLSGGANKMNSVNITAKGAKVTVKNAGNQIASLVTDAATSLTLDLTSVKIGSQPLLKMASGKVSKGQFKVMVGAAQKTGAYSLGLRAANNTVFSVKSSGATLANVRVGGSAVVKNGVSYKMISSGGYAKLSVTVKGGKIIAASGARSASAATLNGGSDSDIFLVRAGNEIINGGNGRDTAVYGKDAWGKDVVNATSGTMTLVFNGLKASDLSIKKNGADMIISKKAAPEQSVTVRQWNDATHNIVYGGTMTQFSKYAAATNPNATLKNAATKEVWQKAGLLA